MIARQIVELFGQCGGDIFFDRKKQEVLKTRRDVSDFDKVHNRMNFLFLLN